MLLPGRSTVSDGWLLLFLEPQTVCAEIGNEDLGLQIRRAVQVDIGVAIRLLTQQLIHPLGHGVLRLHDQQLCPGNVQRTDVLIGSPGGNAIQFVLIEQTRELGGQRGGLRCLLRKPHSGDRQQAHDDESNEVPLNVHGRPPGSFLIFDS
jgi:hypothetical protein